MAKIHWFKQDDGKWKGHLFPLFLIYAGKDFELTLFIFDDKPQSIPIKSVQQGKIIAAKYLKALKGE